MFIRILPTTLLQIFCMNLLYFKVIFQSMKIADDTFLRNSECEWVKLEEKSFSETAVDEPLYVFLCWVEINQH